jgi:phospholipase/carboxylesterase
MAPPSEASVIEAIGGLLSPLLGAFERVAWVQRHLFPPMAERLGEALASESDGLAAALRRLEALPCPDQLRFMRDRLVQVARETAGLVAAFVDAAASPGDVIGLYRPLRRFAAVQEALYPLAPVLDPVSRWFLEPARRNDDVLVARLRAAALRDDPPPDPHDVAGWGPRRAGGAVEAPAGVMHAGNDRAARGGFSLYVPESWDGRVPRPLVVALHGGHGHGRDFLWSWLGDARSREALVLAPTSRDRTWSIMGGDDVDADNLRGMVEFVAARYPIDRERILLTGMSDGATYALVCGLRDDMPFTHLAPACGVLHPWLLADGGLGRARGRSIYVIHGALDWMFPVQVARQAQQVLAASGARVVYREIDDLSHTYPRDENPRILDWLMAA